MRIAIIGCGATGLCAAKIMSEAGHEVKVFEMNSSIGGVWNVCYPGAQLQNTSAEYQFSEFPMKKDAQVHPTKEDILEYLNEYADHFDLRKLIAFRTKVTSMLYGMSGWTVLSMNLDDQTKSIEHFKYVIVAKGQFFDGNHLPKVIEDELAKPNRTSKVEIYHDRGYVHPDQLKNKRIAVLGFGKTAVDIIGQAVEHASVENPVHHIYRSPRWIVPAFFLGLIHFPHLMFSRFGNWFGYNWNPSNAQQIVFKFLPFIRWMFFALVQFLIRITLGIWPYHPLAPAENISTALRSSIALVPPNYMPALRAKKIQLHRDEIREIRETGIQFESGKFLEIDTLICATGYTPSLEFIPQFEHLMEDDGIYLYRHIVHPDIPDLAFIGFNANFFLLPITEISAYWLLEVMDGRIKLPAKEVQHEFILKTKKFYRENVLYEPSRAQFVGARYFTYLDDLCGDLKLNSNLKTSKFSELFEAYTAADFAKLTDVLRKRNQHQNGRQDGISHDNVNQASQNMPM